MARMTSMEALDKKIEKAQELVSSERNCMMRPSQHSVTCWISVMLCEGTNW